MSRRQTLVLLSAIGLLAAAPVGAQAPTPRESGRPPASAVRGPLVNTAQFLLSRSTALELTNDQVVELADLARAADARREQLRADLLANRPAERPQTEAERAELRARLQPLRGAQRDGLQQEREAAIAVLTTEQQAVAWELLASARARPAAAMRMRQNAPAAPADRRRNAPRPPASAPQGR